MAILLEGKPGRRCICENKAKSICWLMAAWRPYTLRSVFRRSVTVVSKCCTVMVMVMVMVTVMVMAVMMVMAMVMVMVMEIGD